MKMETNHIPDHLRPFLLFLLRYMCGRRVIGLTVSGGAAVSQTVCRWLHQCRWSSATAWGLSAVSRRYRRVDVPLLSRLLWRCHGTS